jgi:hypothetical protein
VLWVKKRSHPGFFYYLFNFFLIFFYFFYCLGASFRTFGHSPDICCSPDRSRTFSDFWTFSGHMLQPGTFSDILGLSDILRTYVAARNVLGHSRTLGHSPDICCSPERSRTFSDFRTLSGHMSRVGVFSDVLGLSDILRTYVACRSILGRSRTFGCCQKVFLEDLLEETLQYSIQ